MKCTPYVWMGSMDNRDESDGQDTSCSSKRKHAPALS